jgi:hypothetical protein
MSVFSLPEESLSLSAVDRTFSVKVRNTWLWIFGCQKSRRFYLALSLRFVRASHRLASVLTSSVINLYNPLLLACRLSGEI